MDAFVIEDLLFKGSDEWSDVRAYCINCNKSVFLQLLQLLSLACPM